MVALMGALVCPPAARTCHPAASMSSRAAISNSSVSLRAFVPRVRPVAASRAQLRVAASAEDISYVMVKPDGVQRGVVGEIISRFERKGFQLKALKLYQTPREVAEEHYKDLKSKPFYKDLVDYIVSGPVVCMVWGGHGVVKSARLLIGATNPLEAAPGTIRGDLAVEVGRNVVHGSDSDENAVREMNLWFEDSEVIAWKPSMMPWLREEGRF